MLSKHPGKKRNPMKIVNYRHRFANNSSSSHSVCFRRGTVIPSPNPLAYPISSDNVHHDLDSLGGWSSFEASDPVSKASYIALAIYDSIDQFMGSTGRNLNSAEYVAEAMTGVPRDWVSGSIDHQSAFMIPMGYPERHWSGGSYTIPTEFLESLQEIIINNEDAVIFGGNDNDYDYPPNVDEYNIIWHMGNVLPQRGRYICRREHTRIPGSHIYTLYNIDNGDRVTVDLAPWVDTTHTKLEAPLLVDMKITDFCKYGCAFCYQGSTEAGRHAAPILVDQILEDLHRMKVFEVAFGGGEPTTHPQFGNILNECSKFGIQPNFTTFNLNFMKDTKLKTVVKSVGSSFAVSNPTEATLTKIRYLRDEGYRVSAQYVDGIKDLTRLLTKCKVSNIPVTILGYKTSGRGQEYLSDGSAQHNFMSHDDFMSRVDGCIAYDTVFMRQHTEALPHLDSRSYDTREGYQSWYIDAVSQKHGPSSYETTNMLPLRYKFDLTTKYNPKVTHVGGGLEKDWASCPVTE